MLDVNTCRYHLINPPQSAFFKTPDTAKKNNIKIAYKNETWCMA